MSGPIFGLYSEHLSVVFRGIGSIRSQTRRNSTTSTIANLVPRVSIPTTKGGREERPWERGWTIVEGNIDITRSIFVRSRQRSTTYRLKRYSNVALFPCGVTTVRNYRKEDLFTLFCYFAPVTRHSVQTMFTM